MRGWAKVVVGLPSNVVLNEDRDLVSRPSMTIQRDDVFHETRRSLGLVVKSRLEAGVTDTAHERGFPQLIT